MQFLAYKVTKFSGRFFCRFDDKGTTNDDEMINGVFVSRKPTGSGGADESRRFSATFKTLKLSTYIYTFLLMELITIKLCDLNEDHSKHSTHNYKVLP